MLFLFLPHPVLLSPFTFLFSNSNCNPLSESAQEKVLFSKCTRLFSLQKYFRSTSPPNVVYFKRRKSGSRARAQCRVASHLVRQAYAVEKPISGGKVQCVPEAAMEIWIRVWCLQNSVLKAGQHKPLLSYDLSIDYSKQSYLSRDDVAPKGSKARSINKMLVGLLCACRVSDVKINMKPSWSSRDNSTNSIWTIKTDLPRGAIGADVNGFKPESIHEATCPGVCRDNYLTRFVGRVGANAAVVTNEKKNQIK